MANPYQPPQEVNDDESVDCAIAEKRSARVRNGLFFGAIFAVTMGSIGFIVMASLGLVVVAAGATCFLVGLYFHGRHEERFNSPAAKNPGVRTGSERHS